MLNLKWVLQSSGCLILAGTLSMGAAYAQNNAAAPSQSITGQSELTDREKLDFGREAVSRIQSGIDTVEKEADASRKDRDILRLNCLNEKLTDLRALAKVTETAFAQMDTAISRAQDERADHEFQKIVIADRRAVDLTAEAQACTGEGVLQSAEGQTSVSVQTDITDEEILEAEDGYLPPFEDSIPLDPSEYIP